MNDPTTAIFEPTISLAAEVVRKRIERKEEKANDTNRHPGARHYQSHLGILFDILDTPGGVTREQHSVLEWDSSRASFPSLD